MIGMILIIYLIYLRGINFGEIDILFIYFFTYLHTACLELKTNATGIGSHSYLGFRLA